MFEPSNDDATAYFRQAEFSPNYPTQYSEQTDRILKSYCLGS